MLAFSGGSSANMLRNFALALVAASVAAAPSETAHSLQPDAAAVPRWAHELARRLRHQPAQQTLLAQTLLADWNEDARRFPINASGTVLRNASSVPGATSHAVLPAPLAPRRAPRELSIGVLQMQAVHGNVSASIAKASALLAAGPPGHLDLLVLPELAFAGYVWDHADELAPVAEAADGPTFRWASAAAKARGAHVLVGFAERDAADANRLHNAAMVVGPDGALVTVARKTALTDTDALWAERGSGANSMPVVDVPGVGRIGVGICKDMSVVPVGAVAGEHHMDNSFRAAEVDVIAVLAAWDSSDAREVIHEKWKARVSRHLGTPTVLVVADQTGAELGVPYAGASTVMDLAGPTTLGQLDHEEQLLVVKVPPMAARAAASAA